MESRPKSAHRYNVQEQQDVYKEEISRIWKAQYDSLSNPISPELTQEDEDRVRGRGKFRAQMESVVGTPRDARGSSPGSRGSSMDRDDGMSATSGRNLEGQNKLLRVKRLVRWLAPFSPLLGWRQCTDFVADCQVNGQWETEIVRDPGVIRAYVRQRQMIDDEKTDADDLRPSDDEGKNERRKKRQVVSLKLLIFVLTYHLSLSLSFTGSRSNSKSSNEIKNADSLERIRNLEFQLARWDWEEKRLPR